MSSNNKDDWTLYGVMIGALTLFSFFIIGFPATRAIIGFAIALLPLHLALMRFDFSFSEALIFSLIATIIILPTLVWGIGFLIPFKMAILLSLALFVGGAISVFHFNKKESSSP